MGRLLFWRRDLNAEADRAAANPVEWQTSAQRRVLIEEYGEAIVAEAKAMFDDNGANWVLLDDLGFQVPLPGKTMGGLCYALKLLVKRNAEHRLDRWRQMAETPARQMVDGDLWRPHLTGPSTVMTGEDLYGA